MTYRKFTPEGVTRHLARAALAGGALAACAGGALAQEDAGRGLSLVRALGLPLALRSYHLHRIEAVAGGVLVSGHVPGPYSTGMTGGAFLRLEDGFEEEAAGKTIRVTVTLSGPTGGAVAVAYSTNDLGNSGWRGFTLTAEPMEHVFEYAAPPLVGGNGDYVGVDPDPEGTGQAVTVHAIRVDVLAGEAS